MKEKKLEQLLQNLNILPEMYSRAKEVYDEISEHLTSYLAQYSPSIYQQGSFSLGTVVRPVSSNDEYDVDIVCVLDIDKDKITPANLKRIVTEALKDKYVGKFEDKDRCCRINFDNFHVDILPALPEKNETELYNEYSSVNALYTQSPILIPQKGFAKFKSSNPAGYSLWFNRRYTEEQARINNTHIENSLNNPMEKTNTLVEIVKIMKRHRDYMFKNDPENKPISIIITTLVGNCYSGESDVFEGLRNVIAKMPDNISRKEIRNPVQPKENFADKWVDKPERQRNFNKWLDAINDMLDALEKAENNDAVNDVLFNSFGTTIPSHISKVFTPKEDIQPTRNWSY